MLRQLGSVRLAEKKLKKPNSRTVQPTTCTSSGEPNSGTVKPTTSSTISSAACSSPVSASSCVSSDSSSDSDDEIEITKETTGAIDKYGPLANLQASDYDIINDSSYLGGLIVTLSKLHKCFYKM